MPRRASYALVLALCAATVISNRTAAASPWPSRLQTRSFAVVAVIDTGINPYHRDFRASELTEHPSRYVEGFPSDAEPLHLTLEERSFEQALERDADEWAKVGDAELVWIPGTNIIGAMNVGGRESKFLDTYDHGTAVASLAGGRIHGPGTNDILIVAINDWDYGLRWAAKQPWIDVITNSWSPFLPYPFDTNETARTSRRAIKSGKVVCFASGNEASPTTKASAGPSWVLTVGAASAKTRGEHVYTNYPNDALGLSHVEAAANNSVRGTRVYDGTSFAAPQVCGHAAQAIAAVRERLNVSREGPQAGWLVKSGRLAKGPLGDGKLCSLEVEEAILKTADPARAAPPSPIDDPWAVPSAGPGAFLRGGYGIVDRDSGAAALRVLLGSDPMPSRPIEDAWVEATDRVRERLWGEPPEPPCRH